MSRFKMSDGYLLQLAILGICLLILAFFTPYLSFKGKISAAIGGSLLLFSSISLLRGCFMLSLVFKKSWNGKQKAIFHFLILVLLDSNRGPNGGFQGGRPFPLERCCCLEGGVTGSPANPCWRDDRQRGTVRFPMGSER